MPLVSEELLAGSSHECSPPWTWSASVSPWPRDLTCPEVTPHLLQQADHLLANDHPIIRNKQTKFKNQELLGRGAVYRK